MNTLSRTPTSLRCQKPPTAQHMNAQTSNGREDRINPIIALTSQDHLKMFIGTLQFLMDTNLYHKIWIPCKYLVANDLDVDAILTTCAGNWLRTITVYNNSSLSFSFDLIDMISPDRISSLYLDIIYTLNIQ